MENNKEKKSIDDLLDEFNDVKKSQKQKKAVIMGEKTGLIERVDRIFVTSDGRQLLREQY